MACSMRKQAKASPNAHSVSNSVPQLQGEILVLVLNWLTLPEDFSSCSMVSKAWADAITRTYPRELKVEPHPNAEEEPHPNAEEEFRHSVHQLRWLQGLQQSGRLQHLQKIELLDLEHSSRADPSPLSQGLVVLAGCWNLRTCRLVGRFSLTAAIDYLPTTLLSLDLWPNTAPEVIHLSRFQRFGKLQELILGLDYCGDPEDEIGTLHNFVLDAAALSIERLSIHDRLHTSMLAGWEVDCCLPNIQVLDLGLKASQSGLQFAHSVLKLKQLRKLDHDLYNGDGQETTLVIPEASHLDTVLLRAPRCTPRVSCVIAKPSVAYTCYLMKHVSRENCPWSIGI